MSIQGLEQLEAFAVRLEHVAKLGEEGPTVAAEAIGEKASEQYAAQRSPSGAPWKPRKKDGAPALQRAPIRVRFFAQGDGVYEDAPDHYKFHRTGTRRGLPKRSVFVEHGRIPIAWHAAVDKALERKFAERMR